VVGSWCEYDVHEYEETAVGAWQTGSSGTGVAAPHASAGETLQWPDTSGFVSHTSHTSAEKLPVCADIPLRSYSLAHSLTVFTNTVKLCAAAFSLL